MNFTKIKGSSVNFHFFNHDARTINDNVKSRKNESIDPFRTDENYSLLNIDGKCNTQSDYDRYLKRLSELEKFNRGDVNTLIQGIFTMPKGMQHWDKEDQKEVFEEVLNFMGDRFGKKNIVSANVHLDETSPHMHFKIIPVALNSHGKESVCCKRVLNKTNLRTIHPDLAKYLNEKLPISNKQGPTSWAKDIMCNKYQKQLSKRFSDTQTSFVKTNIDSFNFKYNHETKSICEGIVNAFTYIEDYQNMHFHSMPTIREYINSLIDSFVLDSETANKILENYIKMGYNIDESVNQLEMD